MSSSNNPGWNDNVVPEYDELSKSDLIKVNENNVLDFARFWENSPRVNLSISSSMGRIELGVKQPLGNWVYKARITGDVEKTIEDTKAFFVSKGNEGIMWFTHPLDKPENLGELLIEHGFSKGGSSPLMSMDLKKLGDMPEIPGLEIQPVSTFDGMRTFYDIFRRTLKAFERIADDFFLIDCDCGFNTSLPRRYFIGSLDGVPASISGILLGSEVAGVYNVGTLPEFRRRGLGTALTLACLHESRDEGYNVGVLQSSQIGFNVYKRMGFNLDGERVSYIYKVE
jgi:ribosomal protein S18 acetylase RimI-like enzyme